MFEKGELKMKLKYRVKSKFRFSIFIALMLLIVYLAFTNILGYNLVSGESKEVYHHITVESGDTLWSISSKYAPAKTDIRAFIYEVSKLNDITPENLKVGDHLIIPKN